MLRLSALLLLMLTACSESDAPKPASADTIPFRADASLDLIRDGQAYQTLATEIADTDSSRQRGLMERAPLEDDQAMLFVFDAAGPQTFWMANTPSALDIAFVAADSTVLNVAKYVRPNTTDGVSSEGAAQFVLEVRAGWADTYGLRRGDRLRW
jgi:uncharacterized membrane protein (UPF0127 family)